MSSSAGSAKHIYFLYTNSVCETTDSDTLFR
jgi:hypothetical protein